MPVAVLDTFNLQGKVVLMCDILLAMPNATETGHTIFGKNSDRPAGETQVLYSSVDENRDPDGMIQCAYVNIPERGVPFRTMGCRPYWCWGYETGLNEFGVVGGNVAVFTRALKIPGQVPGLTGMELLRLGLERGKTAREAAAVVAGLLEDYGQWGSAVLGCGHYNGSYDNSFIFTDAEEAWVLETAGRNWVAEKIGGGTRSLSNQLSIRTQWTSASPNLYQDALDQKWINPGEPDFALTYSDHENYARQVSHIRQMRSGELLKKDEGHVSVSKMMKYLSDHYEGTFLNGPQFHEYMPDFLSICMHNSPAGFTWGNTATSVVVALSPQEALPVLWLCYGPPCSGIYMPFWLGVSLPDIIARAGTAGLELRQPECAVADAFSPESLWRRMYRILQKALENPWDHKKQLKDIFSEVQLSIFQDVSLITGDSDRDALALQQLAAEQVDKVLEAVKKIEKMWQLSF